MVQPNNLPIQNKSSSDLLIELEQEVYEISEEHSSYLHGSCHIFAMALAQLGAGNLAGLVEFDYNVQKTALVHAFLKTTNGIIDIKGYRTVEDAQADFHCGIPDEVDFDVSDLLVLGEGDSAMTSRVRLALEAARPIALRVMEIARKQIEIIDKDL